MDTATQVLGRFLPRLLSSCPRNESKLSPIAVTRLTSTAKSKFLSYIRPWYPTRRLSRDSESLHQPPSILLSLPTLPRNPLWNLRTAFRIHRLPLRNTKDLSFHVFQRYTDPSGYQEARIESIGLKSQFGFSLLQSPTTRLRGWRQDKVDQLHVTINSSRGTRAFLSRESGRDFRRNYGNALRGARTNRGCRPRLHSTIAGQLRLCQGLRSRASLGRSIYLFYLDQDNVYSARALVYGLSARQPVLFIRDFDWGLRVAGTPCQPHISRHPQTHTHTPSRLCASR